MGINVAIKVFSPLLLNYGCTFFRFCKLISFYDVIDTVTDTWGFHFLENFVDENDLDNPL